MTRPTSAPRHVLVIAHTGRERALHAVVAVVSALARAGVDVVVGEDQAPVLDAAMRGADVVGGFRAVPVDEVGAPAADVLHSVDLVLVLGGDGTILRAAEIVRGTPAPLLGVNLGHVGFLAESELDGLADTVDRLVAGDYEVEERMTVDVTVLDNGDCGPSGVGRTVARTWALNEVAVEKASRQRMLEIVLEVDGRPLTRFGCDGIVTATPTGSTAYAFSAGGPVVWPEVEAMLVVPLSAHALFARPLLVGTSSVVAVETVPGLGGAGVLWADGRRSFELPEQARVEVRPGAVPVRLARLSATGFTERLVQRFRLPVNGWRGPGGAT
ncbi:NAD kinase [Aquipuribacter nitratireducens]|uniref:NAD kinase n=1 Tax=Aquipuribacter nitratireducens TaxID=650104 RepID=A0ABW0GRC8_9MICO